jgi:hypothetical protein
MSISEIFYALKLILIAFILFENCCRNIVEIPKVYNETRL